MKARHSVFPHDIDKRSYFSDVSLMNKGILSEHHTLMSLRRYQEAAEKLEDSGVDFYGAELFNYLEECLYNLGQILQHKHATPSRPIYGTAVPESLALHTIWISAEELPSADL